jgi:hypothetical protein
MNRVNLAVDVVRLPPYREVTAVYIPCAGGPRVALHIPVSYLAVSVVAAGSHQFGSALASVFRLGTAPASVAFGEVKVILCRRDASAADVGIHTATGDSLEGVVVEGGSIVTVGDLRSAPGESSAGESSTKSLGAAPRMEMQILVGIHISDPAVRNWYIFRQVNSGIPSTGSVPSVSRSS